MKKDICFKLPSSRRLARALMCKVGNQSTDQAWARRNCKRIYNQRRSLDAVQRLDPEQAEALPHHDGGRFAQQQTGLLRRAV